MSQTLNNFTLSGGLTLDLDAGSTTLTGAATLVSGAVEGPGALVVAAGATALLDNPSFGSNALFDIAGTAIIGASGAPQFGDTTPGGVAIIIETSGTFLLNPNGQAVSGARASMTNLGLLSSPAVNGTATNSLYFDLVNTGTILVSNGTLALDGTGVSSLGGTITGAGALDLGNGSFQFDPAVLTIGTLIFGGDSVLAGDQAFGGVVAEAAGGTLDLDSNSLALSGGGTLNGVVTGPGVLDVTGGGFVLAGSVVAGVTLEGMIETAPGAAIRDVVNDATLVATASYSLTLFDTITNAGGTIIADGGVVTVDSGVDITGGTLATSAGGVIVGIYAYFTLDGVTNAGFLKEVGETLALRDSLSNTGTIQLESGEESAGILIASPVVTLSGSGTIELPGGRYDPISAAPGGGTLVNLGNLIQGAGTIGYGTGLAVINAGTIASYSSGEGTYGLFLDPAAGLTNTGLIETIGDSSLYLYGIVANAGGTIAANVGFVVLQNGVDIIGGTVATSGGGIISAPTAATLDGVMNSGTMLVGDGSTLYLGDSVSNTGTIILDGTTAASSLDLDGSVSLTGGGVIALRDDDGRDVISTGSIATLDNVDNLITGAGSIGNYQDLVLVNAGTIAASGSAHGLVIDSDELVTNTGLIEAIGTMGLSLVGTVDNAGGTIAAFGSQAAVGINGDIIGGTLATRGGGVITGLATLDGVLNAGTVRVDGETTVTLQTSLINQGLVTLVAGVVGAFLDIGTTTTLTGHGTIVLAEGQSSDVITAETATTSLVNTDNLIEGAGTIGYGSTLSVINAGTIAATGGTHALAVNPKGGVTNTGLMEATAAGGLSLSGVISNAGGTIAATGSTAGVILNGGGDVIGGTLATGSGGVIRISGGTLDGVRNTGLVLAATAYDILQLRNSLINSGTVAIAGLSRYATLQIATPTVTLGGGGTIALSNDGASADIKAASSAATLVNVDNLIIGAGTIGNGATLNLALVNAGTIDADDAINALVIGLTTFTNTGLLEATGTAGLILNTAVQNVGGTIAARGSNVGVQLPSGGDVVGGTLATGTGGFINVFDGTLDGVRNTGSVLVTNAYATLHLRDSLFNRATIAVVGTSHYAELKIDTAAVTLSGGGTIALSNSGAGAYIVAGLAGATLVNVDNFIIGAGTIGRGTSLNVANAGTIDASDAVNALAISVTTLTNTGLLEATGTAGLDLTSRVENAGGTIAATGQNIGVLLQAGGDVVGGTLTTGAGGVISIADGTLDGVQNTGSVLAASGYDILHLRNSLTNSGTLTIEGSFHYAALQIDTPTATLSGGGTMALSNDGASAFIQAGSAAATLVNVDNLIAGAGTIGNGTGLAVSNAGTIDADDAVHALVINVTTLTNGGLLEATGIGGLTLSDSVLNTGGTIAATGTGVGVTLFNGADIAGGTIAAAGGGTFAAAFATLDGVTNSGSLLLAAGDTLHLRDGLANAGALTDTGATLAIDTQAVTLSGGGTFALSGIAVLETGLAAASLDNIDNLIAGNGTIAIGAGLTLVNAGTIDANAAAALTIDTIGTFSNAGLLEATGAGGLFLSDSVLNTGGTIAATGADVTLQDGADIIGGTLAAAGGGTIAAGFATLDGVTNSGTLLLAAGDTLHLRDGFANAGRLADAGAMLAIDTPSVTLDGGGTFALSGIAVLETGLAAASLDNVDNLIAGAGTIAIGAGLTLVNAGTIDANDTAALTIDTIGTFSNGGLLEATGAGGLFLSNSVLNTGGTIAATGADVTLQDGADIIGGTLASAGGGTISAGSATLDGVTNSGSLLLAAGNTLHLRDGFANAGRLADAGATLAIDMRALTLSGGGTVAVAGTAVIDTGLAAATLDNVDNQIAGSGTIAIGAGLTLVNAGTIDANDTAALTIDTIGGFTNTGVLEATGAGGLLVTSGTTIGNAGGLMLAVGSEITLREITIAGGTLAGIGGGRFLASGATLDGGSDPLALAAGTTLAVAASATLSSRGSILNAGTVLLGGSLGVLSVDSATTLGGGGTISLAGGGGLAGNGFLIGGTAGLDDIDNTIGGSGTIGGTLSLGAGAAVIGSAAGLVLDAATGNAGLLESAGGTLAIGGVVRDAGGAVTANGGLVSLAGADLVGGTLATNLSGTLLVAGSSTFDGSQAPVFASGSLLVGAGLALLGTLANSGTVTLTGTGAAGALLIGSTPATLDGGGTLVLGGDLARVAGGTLVDRDEQILGGGSLGAGTLSLVNLADGLIAATSGLLVIDPGAAGTITNAGAIEADGAGLAIASGSLTNTGTLAALDATLTAHGAAQDQAGTLAGGTWLSRSVAAASTLAIGGAAVTEDNADIILSGVSSAFLSGPSALALEQSLLTVDSTGTLTLEGGRGFLSTTTLTNSGTLQLGQGSFGTTGSGTLVNDGLIAGTGTLAGKVVNLGTIAATADPLTIGTVSGPGTLLVDAGGGSMVVAGSVAGGIAQFGGAGAILTLEETAAFGDVIAGFGTGDTIDLADIGGVNALSYDAASDVLSLFLPQPVATGAPPIVVPVATLHLAGTYTAANFGFRQDAAGHGTSIVVPCFLAGTRLATTRGKIAVEELAVGDVAVTATGSQPVVWIGQRTMACDRHPRPDLVWPVLILADAFGPGQPERDLRLSPDHAVLWQGVLIPIKHLLNGATIRQERTAQVRYYHVELARHDVVLAEGLPAESYLDTGNRSQFSGGATIGLHPDFSCQGGDDACARLCTDGEQVAAARAHLLARAAAIGFTKNTPWLRVRADGIARKAVRARGLLHRFLLPAGTREVALISSIGVPAAADILAADHRTLGACIGGIVVGGRAIPLDEPALFAGFLAIERDGRRWTDGAARLALPPARHPMALDLLVLDVMPGWVGAGLHEPLMANDPAG